jgi:hypothetical protein
MVILLEEERSGGKPVLKPRQIGQGFVGCVIKYDRRDSLDQDGKPRMNSQGKPAQELVVTLLTIESSMPAGIGGETAVPEPGDIVRDIRRGGAYGQWIDADKELKSEAKRSIAVGDIILITTTHGVTYNSTTYKQVAELRTPEEVDAWRSSSANMDRRESLGMRGELHIKPPEPKHGDWVAKAEEAYHGMTPVSSGIPAGRDEEPFGAPASSGPSFNAF